MKTAEMNDKINTRSIVAKSNDLIPQMSNYDLQDLRLIAYCLSCYNSKSNDNRKFAVRVSHIADIFEMDDTSASSVMQRVVKAVSQPLLLKNSIRDKYIFWFSEFSYIKNKGIIEFTLNDTILPYVLELRERFSVYRIGDVNLLKTKNAFILFENLNRWKNTEIWQISVNDLKLLLSKENKYKRFDSFRIRCIDEPLKEINEKTNLFVEYNSIKDGTKITHFQFIIHKKDDDTKKNNKIFIMLLECKINRKLALKLSNRIYESGNEEYFIAKIREIKSRWSIDKGNLQGYIVAALNNELNNMYGNVNPYDIPSHDEDIKSKDKPLTDEDYDQEAMQALDNKIFNEFIEEMKYNNKFIYDIYLKYGKNDLVCNIYCEYVEKYLQQHPEIK